MSTSPDELSALLQHLEGAGGVGKSLSFDSPMGGDDVTDVVPVQKGLELVLVNDASALCRGKVGETKMCLCLAEECEIKSHKRSRVPLSRFSSSRCLLVGGGANLSCGFLTPLLDASNLEPSLISSLLGRVNEEWGQLFELVAVEGIQDLETEESVKDLSKTVRKRMLGTPNVKRQADDRAFLSCSDSVKKARHVLRDGLTAKHVNELIKASADANGNPDADKLQEFHDAVAIRLDLSVGYSMGLERLLDLLKESLQAEIIALEDKVGGTKATTTMIEGAVGSRCKTMEGCHPTLWGSVAELSTTIQHHHDLINGILKSLLKLKANMPRSKNVSFSPTSGITDPMSSDGGLSADAFFDHGGFNTSEPMDVGTNSPTIQDGFLRRRSEGLGGGGSGGGGPSSGGSSHTGSAPSGSNTIQSGSTQSSSRAGDERMNRLEERVDLLESTQSGVTDDSVVLDGNIILRSKQDVMAMLERFLGVNCEIPAGAFTSPHFLLNEMMTTLGCSLPNLDEIVKLKRLGVKAIDLRNAQALMAILPLFFTSGKLSTHIYGSGSSGRFRAFPNAGEWGSKTDEDKLQFKCQKALDEVCKAVEEHIRDCFRQCATLQLIAHNQLSKSKRVVIECLEFLGDNYTRMMAAFESSSEAWDLGCFGILQLFNNEFSVPLACMKFADFSEARATLLTTVWTNLRLGAIADAFLDTGIQNHPAMSSAQVRFIIQQAKGARKSNPAKEIEALKTQVRSLQDVVKKQEQLLDQHTGKLTQVESRADRACAALDLPLDKKRGKGKGGKKAGDEE